MMDKGTWPEQFGFIPQHVAIKDDNCIQIFRLDNGTLVQKIGEEIVKFSRGLAIDDDGNLLTLGNAIHGNSSTELLVFDPVTGKLVKRQPYSPLRGFPSGGWYYGKLDMEPRPRFLDSYGDTLAVTDLGLDVVYLSSITTGTEVRRFGNKGSGPGSFCFVSGISFDGAGNMLIGDAKNNRVQLFNGYGEFVCVIDFGPVEVPFVSDIHLTKTGLLIVACRMKHVVHVFKLEPR